MLRRPSSSNYVVLGCVLVGASAGCKQILGLDERLYAGDDSGSMAVDTSGLRDAGVADAVAEAKPASVQTTGQCGPVKHSSAMCAECMDQNCCDPVKACHDETSCSAVYDCLLTCGDDAACRSRCDSFLNRTDALLEVQACRESHCGSACELSCGGFSYNAPGCSACVKATCCDAASQCAQNIECLKLDQCRLNCLSGVCSSECNTAYPAGAADYETWRACTLNDCQAACEPGHNWECLDAPVWLKPRTISNITFSATIADLLSEAPYVGTLVKACLPTDLACASPADSATTDANGLVTLTVPLGAVGFAGYLEITGGAVKGSENPIFPALYYPVPPLISGGWRGKIQFVSTKDVPLLGATTGTEIDPTLGHFAANAEDCSLAPAGGVSFTADPTSLKTKAFYFVGDLPVTTVDRTDSATPIGGFVNLPAQSVLIKARSVAPGNKFMGTLNVQIRAGYFTSTSFPPNPNAPITGP